MLVIFDYDGTLVDSWAWMAAQLAAGAERFGYRPLDAETIERLRGMETRDVIAALRIRPERIGELVDHLRYSAEGAKAEIEPFPGMPALLELLKTAGDELALVTSNSRLAVASALGPCVIDLFTHCRCGSGIFDKAADFRAVVAASGVGTDAVLCVGDETRDLDAAADAGLDAIAVEWGYADAALLRKRAPGRTAGAPDQLLRMIAARRAGLVQDQP